MGECKKGMLSPITGQERLDFDKTVERLKGFRKGLSRGIEGERKRIVKELKEMATEVARPDSSLREVLRLGFPSDLIKAVAGRIKKGK